MDVIAVVALALVAVLYVMLTGLRGRIRKLEHLVLNLQDRVVDLEGPQQANENPNPPVDVEPFVD